MTIELKPVSQFKIDTLRSSKVEPLPPTYEVKTVTGDVQVFPLDETIATNKDRLPEWNSYLSEKKKLEAEYAKKFLELMIWEGTEVTVPDIESEWQKSNDYFGIVIPDNIVARKMFYVTNEILATQEDVGNLLAEILTVSKIDEEVVDKLRASFRVAIQGQADSRPTQSKRKLANK